MVERRVIPGQPVTFSTTRRSAITGIVDVAKLFELFDSEWVDAAFTLRLVLGVVLDIH